MKRETKILWLFILWIFIWCLCDRLREIAIFPGWESIFGSGWFDQYYTPDTPTWLPHRDAYHYFKWFPWAILFVAIWHYFRWYWAWLLGFTWWLGQLLGKLFRIGGI